MTSSTRQPRGARAAAGESGLRRPGSPIRRRVPRASRCPGRATDRRRPKRTSEKPRRRARKPAHHRHDDHVRDAAAADHRPYRPVFGKLFERPLFAGQRDLLHRAAAALGGGRPRRHVRAEPHRLPRLRHGGKSGHRHQRCAADSGSYPGRRHHDQGRDTLAVRLSSRPSLRRIPSSSRSPRGPRPGTRICST